jgi:hypothetical protein
MAIKFRFLKWHIIIKEHRDYVINDTYGDKHCELMNGILDKSIEKSQKNSEKFIARQEKLKREQEGQKVK